MGYCEQCRHFRVLSRISPPPGDRLLGECRRFPPTVPPTVISIGSVESTPLATFPMLRASEWCGEFEQATSPSARAFEIPGRQTPPRPAQDARLLVSAREAAKMLGISDKTLYTLAKRGEIQPVRVGARVCYSPEALRAWIAAHQGQPNQIESQKK